MTFVELNDMVEREKMVMKEDMVFEAMEADKWQDVFGFSRQMILNGKAYDKILPASGKQSARYVIMLFYNFILQVGSFQQQIIKSG